MFFFRKTIVIRKYWKISIVLLPIIIVLVLKLIVSIRQRKPNDQRINLNDEINEIKDRLEEINTTVIIEAKIEKTKNDQLMNELKEVQKINDAKERRKRLAEMIG